MCNILLHILSQEVESALSLHYTTSVLYTVVNVNTKVMVAQCLMFKGKVFQWQSLLTVRDTRQILIGSSSHNLFFYWSFSLKILISWLSPAVPSLNCIPHFPICFIFLHSPSFHPAQVPAWICLLSPHEEAKKTVCDLYRTRWYNCLIAFFSDRGALLSVR